MTTSTKRLAVVAPLSLLVGAGACFFMAYQVNSAGDALRVQNQALAEGRAKEETFFRLQRTLQESAEERAALEKYFFKSESDGINFLNTIESLGREFGVPIITEHIETVTDQETNRRSVLTRFSFSGPKTAVLDLARLFELLPYKSTVKTLSLSASTESVWDANIELLITIAHHD